MKKIWAQISKEQEMIKKSKWQQALDKMQKCQKKKKESTIEFEDYTIEEIETRIKELILELQDTINVLNKFFVNSKPLTGDALQHLSDYFNKSTKNKSSLPNRL